MLQVLSLKIISVFLATVYKDDCVNYYIIPITKISKWRLLVKRDCSFFMG